MDSQEVLQKLASEQFMFRTGFHVEAIKKIQKFERSGSGNAAHFLSLIHEDGFDCGVVQKLLGYGKQDKELANYYRKRAIERESSGVQFELACAYYYGFLKESGIIKDQDYEKSFEWSVLCVDSLEYTEVSYMGMSLLSELYANGLGCTKNYYLAVLLRAIAEMYNGFFENKWDYVAQSIKIPPDVEKRANIMAMTYFHSLKYENEKSKVALPDSPFVKVFFDSIGNLLASGGGR